MHKPRAQKKFSNRKELLSVLLEFDIGSLPRVVFFVHLRRANNSRSAKSAAAPRRTQRLRHTHKTQKRPTRDSSRVHVPAVQIVGRL